MYCMPFGAIDKGDLNKFGSSAGGKTPIAGLETIIDSVSSLAIAAFSSSLLYPSGIDDICIKVSKNSRPLASTSLEPFDFLVSNVHRIDPSNWGFSPFMVSRKGWVAHAEARDSVRFMIQEMWRWFSF
jgi:hypothetical protein